MNNNKLHFFIYFIIFSLPFYLARFSVFGIPTNILEAMIVILFLLFLFKNFKVLYSLLFISYSFFQIGIILLFVGLILSIFQSNDIFSSLGIIKSWFVIPLLFYIVVKSVLKNKDEKIKALLALLLSGTLISIIGLVYFILENLTYDNRLQAFYEHPNMLAMIIAITAIILISKLKVQKEKLLFIILFLLFFILYMTASLGAWIGLLLALIFYFLSIKYLILNTKHIHYILYIIIAIGLLLPIGSIFTNPWEMGRNSYASRLMVWQASAEIIKDNFVLGIGQADFQDKYLEYQKKFEPYLEWAVPHPHNLFLQIWLMGGIISLIGFIIILVNVFRKITNYKQIPMRQLTDKSQFISITVITILIYLLFHGFVDNTIWKNDLAIIFWFLIALI